LIFTFGCCILLRIYPTGSLLRSQSQLSFNTLTPFYFLSHSLYVSAPTGHHQVRYTINKQLLQLYNNCISYLKHVVSDKKIQLLQLYNNCISHLKMARRGKHVVSDKENKRELMY
jgi:hypothetical protein